MAHVMWPRRTSIMRGEAAPRRNAASSACRSRRTLAGSTLTAPRLPSISRPMKTDTAEAVSIECTGPPRLPACESPRPSWRSRRWGRRSCRRSPRPPRCPWQRGRGSGGHPR
eukprot:4255764-Pyramimonas_sp.AAC.1